MPMPYDLSQHRILITGATGRLGSQIVYELSKRKIKPVVVVRAESNTRYVDSLGLEKRQADLRQVDQLKALLDGIDLVIHCAALVEMRQDRLTQFAGVNTMSALSLFEQAAKCGVKRFLHVSTIAAVGAAPRTQKSVTELERESVTEEWEFNLRHLRIPYVMTKRAAEEELLRAAAGSTCELVIVNPSIIITPEPDGDIRRRWKRVLGYKVLPDLRLGVNFVDVRDVAPGVLAALEKGRSGERYILAGDNSEVRELVFFIGALLDRAPQLIAFPSWGIRAVAALSVAWDRLRGRSKISFYPDLVRLIDYDWIFSSAKARRELGYRFRSVHDTIDDLLSNRFHDTWLRPKYPSAE